jgi:hypothetical protein
MGQVTDRTSKLFVATWPFSKFKESIYEMKEYYHSTIGLGSAAVSGGACVAVKERSGERWQVCCFFIISAGSASLTAV